MKLPRKEGVQYHTLHFHYLGKALSMDFEIQHKFGEVNYILYSNSHPTFYQFRKLKRKPFELVYGKLPEQLVQILIQACDEDLLKRKG